MLTNWTSTNLQAKKKKAAKKESKDKKVVCNEISALQAICWNFKFVYVC